MIRLIRNPNGQALIELIIFLPLILALYSVISGFANAINGSINQQKVTRAYFYSRVQNNSTVPGPNLVGDSYGGWGYFGAFYIGWKNYFKGDGIPIMPCYRVNIPMRNGPKDNCEEANLTTSTLWIRVGTAYGICGTSFYHNNNRVFYLPDFPGYPFTSMIDKISCTRTQ